MAGRSGLSAGGGVAGGGGSSFLLNKSGSCGARLGTLKHLLLAEVTTLNTWLTSLPDTVVRVALPPAGVVRTISASGVSILHALTINLKWGNKAIWKHNRQDGTPEFLDGLRSLKLQHGDSNARLLG